MYDFNKPVLGKEVIPAGRLSLEQLSHQALQNQTGGKVWCDIYKAAVVLQEKGINIKDSDGKINWTRSVTKAEAENLLARCAPNYQPSSQATSSNNTSSSNNSGIYIGNPHPQASVVKVTINGNQVIFSGSHPVNIEGRVYAPAAQTLLSTGPFNRVNGNNLHKEMEAMK